MIELPRDLYDEVVRHALDGRPNEACGVLAGVDGKIARFYPMRNAEESPVVYRFDEREQLRVFADVEEQGWELTAFVHSHTHTPAYPSPTDIANAHWRDPVDGDATPAYPDTAYLILSLANEEPDLRAFRFEDQKPVDEEIAIV